MKTELILTGIQDATCRDELSAHIDLIEEAIERGACDYGVSEWLKIAAAIDLRNAELNNSVFH